MEVEKRSSKGGLFHLFDWSGKSRKKLFSSNSELLEGSKQGRQNAENLAMSRLHMTEVEDNGASSTNKGSSDYNYASSVASDEGYGTRAPGVVARLMGLDSLPTSNVCEPFSIPFIDSHSLRDAIQHRSNTNLQSEHCFTDYSNIYNKLEGFSGNAVNSMPQKMRRPIERFQTEILPPKSAKSIPITHHKLLSPIKSPSFIPTKNAAYVMQAAVKIIEPGPQAPIKAKISSPGSSSVPLKIRQLKEKMEAAQKDSGLLEASRRSNQSSPVTYMKGQCCRKNGNGSEVSRTLRVSKNSKESSSSSSNNKGKAISLAVQAKVNVQRRKELSSGSNTNFLNQTEHNEVKSNQVFKSQPSTQKSGLKRTFTNRSSDVLRQNIQKQNAVSNKDKMPSKSSVSSQEVRKAPLMSGSIGPNKTLNKVVLNSRTVSRKMGLVVKGNEKELSPHKTKNFSQKKLSGNGDGQLRERIANNVLINKDDRSTQCNVVADGCMSWVAESRKEGMDVVSFTFTSPIKGSATGLQSSGRAMDTNDSIGVGSHCQNDLPDSKNSKVSSQVLNVIGGDALSVLLEQKLRELTYKIESPHCNVVETETASSSSNMQDSVSSFNEISTESTEQDGRFQVGGPKNKLDSPYDSDCSSIDDALLMASCKWKELEGMEELISSCNNREAGKELDCQHSSPVSSLECSFSNESCYSSDSINSCSTHGSKLCSLVQPLEVVSLISTGKALSMGGETVLPNWSSCTSSGDMDREIMTTTSSLTKLSGPSNWELGYVRDILSNAKLMLEDFELAQTCKVISPYLFDHLENQESRVQRNEAQSKLERKVLFDCVCECLDFSYRQLSIGNIKAWAKWATLSQRKGWLAEQTYKEISGWKDMGDLMVDELVDKDMSTQQWRWLDFEVEAFEEGVKIEKEILISLLDELVADISLF